MNIKKHWRSIKVLVLTLVLCPIIGEKAYAQQVEYNEHIGQTTIKPGTSSVHVPRAGSNRQARIASTAEFEVTYEGSWTIEQKAAFEYTVSIWGEVLETAVPIKVIARFGVKTKGVLASGGGWSVLDPHEGVNVCLPLYNKKEGYDVFPSNDDIKVTISNDPTIPWYYGTDGNTPADKYDFVSVILHEIGHGIGLSSGSTETEDDGVIFTKAYIYDKFVTNSNGKTLASFSSNNTSTEVRNYLTSGDLTWNGTAGYGAVLYSPSTFKVGSSVSHLDESTYPDFNPDGTVNLNAFMTPSISKGESNHNPSGDLVLGILNDMGWTTHPIVGLEDNINLIVYKDEGYGLMPYSGGEFPADAYLFQVYPNFVDEDPYGDYIVSQNFKLVALHENGEYELFNSNASSTYITGGQFNLPIGYDWKRTMDGEVIYQLRLEGIDNDGVTHKDGIEIWKATKPNTPQLELHESNCTDLKVDFYASGATSYTVYCEKPGETRSTVISASNHSYTFSNVDLANQEYEVYVVASNAEGTTTSTTLTSTLSTCNANSALNGLVFDNTENDKVTIPHHQDYDVDTGDFTLEAIVNFDPSQESYPAILSNRDGHYTGFLFGLSGGSPYIRLASTNYSALNPMNIKDGQCHHVAVKRTGNQLEFFVDGNSLGIRNIGVKNITTTRELWVGHDFSTNNTALNGSVKEVRFWNVSRSNLNIVANQNKGLIGDEAGLVGYWKMNEGNGQVIYDHSINFNNGVLGSSSAQNTNDPAWEENNCGVLPIDDAGIQFNRYEHDRITIPHHDNYDIGTSDFTMEAWVNLSTSQNSYPTILSNRTATSTGYLFGFLSGSPYIRMANANYTAPNPINLKDNQCHHVAIIRNGLTLEFIVDGVSRGIRTIGDKNMNAPGDLYIGRDNFSTSSTPLNGSLKEIRIWNIAKTENKIDANKSHQLQGTETGLIGYWKLNDTINYQSAIDYSTTANDGVLGSSSSFETIDPYYVFNSCGNSSSAKKANELVEPSEVKAYPTPFTHQVNIMLGQFEEEVTLNIISINGVLISSNSYTNTNKITLGESLPEGMYIIQLVTASGVKNIKVIKQ